MIVRDEMENLPKSLGAAAELFDEAVVVDTGSKDDTPELAREYGARVTTIDWPDDFAQARNVSIAQASGDWIMWLDADNSVSAVDVERIREKLNPDKRSILHAVEVVVPSFEQLVQKRVFPRRPDVFFQGRVHEQLVHPPDFESVMTPARVLHWGYADKVAARSKGLRNLRLLVEMAKDDSADPYVNYQLGRTLVNLRRFGDAIKYLSVAATSRRGFEENPGLARHARILKAQALERIGEPDQAESELEQLARHSPEYGPVHLALGKIDYAKGEYQRAVNRFDRFLTLGVGDPAAGFNPAQMKVTAAMLKGRSLEKIGRQDEAAAAYEAAAAHDPLSLEPGLALAGLAAGRGDPDRARSHAEACLEKDPHNLRARRLIDRLENDRD
jgi:glycosyltransferase involved in cell wall biosynthesis